MYLTECSGRDNSFVRIRWFYLQSYTHVDKRVRKFDTLKRKQQRTLANMFFIYIYIYVCVCVWIYANQTLQRTKSTDLFSIDHFPLKWFVSNLVLEWIRSIPLRKHWAIRKPTINFNFFLKIEPLMGWHTFTCHRKSFCLERER